MEEDRTAMDDFSRDYDFDNADLKLDNKGNLDIKYYCMPMFQGLHNEAILRLEELQGGEREVLCFWMGLSAGMVGLTTAIEKGDESIVERAGQFIDVAGRKLQRVNGVPLGYK